MKHLLLKSKWVIVALNMVRNHQNKKRLSAGSLLPHGVGQPIKEAREYAQAVFHDYLTYGQLQNRVEGAFVLELGPGANQLVADQFIQHGADHVLSVDKFNCLQDPSYLQKLYQRPLQKVSYKAGVNVEALAKILPPNHVDLIVSRAVLEYASDIQGVFEAMNTVLKPGGRMVHKIDLRDDGMFSKQGHHPLTRFTISKNNYRRMTSHSYRPTSNLMDDYLLAATRLGLKPTIMVTRLVGIEEELNPHLPWNKIPQNLLQQSKKWVAEISCHPDFKKVPESSLMVAGVFMIVDKPQAELDAAAS